MVFQFPGSPERPTGVLKAVFFPGENGPWIFTSPDCLTGVLKTVLFSEKNVLGLLESNIKKINITFKEVEPGINLLEFLSRNKITSSKSEGRRIIKNKGLKLVNILVTDENKFLRIEDFKKDRLKILKSS